MGETEAAEFAGVMIGKTQETGESKQGKYIRTDVLWTSEELNMKSSDYICDNAIAKGSDCEPILPMGDLLPNETLEPDFP